MVLTGGAVAGHGHTGGAVVAHIAENHGDDVDGRAQVVGDAGGRAIIDGPFAVPAFEDRLGGHFQLLERILWKVVGGVTAVQGFKLLCHLLPVVRRQLGILFNAGSLAGGRDDRFERLVVDPHNDTAEHLDQSPIGIVNEAGIIGESDHGRHRLAVEADVENRIHHPGHGKLGTGPAGDQQGIVVTSKALSRVDFDRLKR